MFPQRKQLPIELCKGIHPSLFVFGGCSCLPSEPDLCAEWQSSCSATAQSAASSQNGFPTSQPQLPPASPLPPWFPAFGHHTAGCRWRSAARGYAAAAAGGQSAGPGPFSPSPASELTARQRMWPCTHHVQRLPMSNDVCNGCHVHTYVWEIIVIFAMHLLRVDNVCEAMIMWCCRSSITEECGQSRMP